MRCDVWREELVDYVDGELAAERGGGVAEHLRECADCRRRVEALRRSLGVAQALWNESEQCIQPARARHLSRPARRRRMPLRFLAPALATAAAVLLALILWRGARPATKPAGPGVARGLGTDAALALEIERAGIGAQLLAAADLLAATPGGREIACAQYEYLRREYRTVADEARDRLARNCKE
jgi:predicted anti-sigma-YlaC factor YlaD